jgi:hypothetical protein
MKAMTVMATRVMSVMTARVMGPTVSSKKPTWQGDGGRGGGREVA